MKYLFFFLIFAAIQTQIFAANDKSLLKEIGFKQINISKANINLTNLVKNNNVLLSAFKNKWTLIIFWKSSISRSVKELTLVNQVAPQLLFADINVININLDENIDHAKELIKGLELKYPSYYTNAHGRNLYSSEIIPSTYIFSPRWKYFGKAEKLIGWMYGDFIKKMIQIKNKKK